MALTTEQIRRTLTAFQRFGLGPKPGVFGQVARNPEAALLAELRQEDIALIDQPDLPGYGEACRIAASGYAEADGLFRKELSARLGKQMKVRIGIVERLVGFWSNHFAMSIDKSETIRGLIGQVERDVIRRHVTGRFFDMLVGVVRHPAMIEYLDNDDSIGPNSVSGQAWGAGFNENLAREILELYTVGSGGGYGEADVTEFSLALTGWSFVRSWEADGGYNGGTKKNKGRYIHRRDWHEPGVRRVMGKSYPNTGEKQALEILRDLAFHPKTAEHIAFKLVRHFITDEPTPAQVEPLAAVFRATRGDLLAVAEALVALPDAWSAPFAKIRTPYELQIGAFRAFGSRYAEDEFWAFSEIMRFLHQPTWAPPSPEGFSDETPYWLAPDAMTIRLDAARLTARVLGADTMRQSPEQLARKVYGPALGTWTRNGIATQANPADAMTVFLMSPEFQRR